MIAIPTLLKNGKVQEILMLSELAKAVLKVPSRDRSRWVVNPRPTEFPACTDDSCRPAMQTSSCWFPFNRTSAIARMCQVSATAVKKWLSQPVPEQESILPLVAEALVSEVSSRAVRQRGQSLSKPTRHLSVKRPGRITGGIGKTADIVVEVDDEHRKRRQKYASAHNIKREVAQRLINAGVSAATLKVIMRHDSFATTERHYGARKSADAAAKEIAAKLLPTDTKSELVGGGHEKTPQLSAKELKALKSLLAKL